MWTFEFADDVEREHATSLAVERQAIAARSGAAPTFAELTDEEQQREIVGAAWWLRAGRRAGVYAFESGRSPVVASTRSYPDGGPISRDDYEQMLRKRLEGGDGERLPLLDREEGQVVAALLDELAALFPHEDLGRLAREQAVRIYDRLGI